MFACGNSIIVNIILLLNTKHSRLVRGIIKHVLAVDSRVIIIYLWFLYGKDNNIIIDSGIDMYNYYYYYSHGQLYHFKKAYNLYTALSETTH